MPSAATPELAEEPRGRPSEIVAADDTRRLESDVLALRASALLELGDAGRARRVADAALALHPDNLRALEVLARLSDGGPDWTLASRLWDRVAAVSGTAGQRSAAARRALDIRWAHASSAALGFYAEDGGRSARHSGIRASARMSSSVRPDIVVSLDVRDAASGSPTADVTAPDGNALYRGSVGLGASGTSADWELRFLLADGRVGASGAVGRRTGPFDASLAFRYADRRWLDGGTAYRDTDVNSVRLGAGAAARGFRLDATATFNRYTSDDDRRRSRSFARTARLSYSPPIAAGGSFVLELDAETFGSHGSGDDPPPVDQDRSDRTIGYAHRFELDGRTRSRGHVLETLLGMRRDIDGNAGPRVSLFGTLALSHGTTLELSASYSATTAGSDVADERFAANVTWHHRYGYRGALR